jgi:hypothetical protein
VDIVVIGQIAGQYTMRHRAPDHVGMIAKVEGAEGSEYNIFA